MGRTDQTGFAVTTNGYVIEVLFANLLITCYRKV
jgi:hypothetical protein